jgi:hypothetical protein
LARAIARQSALGAGAVDCGAARDKSPLRSRARTSTSSRLGPPWPAPR